MFERTETIQHMFSDYSEIKLEIKEKDNQNSLQVFEN